VEQHQSVKNREEQGKQPGHGYGGRMKKKRVEVK